MFFASIFIFVTEFFQHFLTVGQDGLRLIATAVLPVLFPFFVLTSLILGLLNTAQPWLVAGLAYCSGYPNGARLTQQLYRDGRINLTTAKCLLITTATPSPMFVIATAGMVFLHDLKLGCVIFLCSVVSAIFNGWLWCSPNKLRRPQLPVQPRTRANCFTVFSNALGTATTAIVNVCGVVLFFYIFTHTFKMPIFISGLLEMTTGVAGTTNPLLVQFFVTFGGLSVAMQQQLFMQDFGIKFQTYVAYKLTHAILACGLLSLYLLFLN